MNTDDGFVVEYKEVLWPGIKEQVHKLLEGTEKSSVEAFLIAAQDPVSVTYAHHKSHSTIPDSKDQKRYLTKLRNKTTQLNKLVLEVSELLDDSPFQLRTLASEANISVHSVQKQLITMLQAINNVTPRKSKYRPEQIVAVMKIAKIFKKHIGAKPIVRAYRTKYDIPAEAKAADRFVPILAELLNIGIDQAYRLAQHVLPS